MPWFRAVRPSHVTALAVTGVVLAALTAGMIAFGLDRWVIPPALVAFGCMVAVGTFLIAQGARG